MTRSVPLWVGRTDDTPAPARVRARIIARQDGICACGCGVKLGMAGEGIDIDHTLALVLGGVNDEANLRALRRPCHGSKTKSDVAQKSIEARKRNKHLGIKAKTKNPLPGSKDSKWKRLVGGTTIRRD
ncbi:HNH endonuclease [Salipiger manganoxidans]|uniref:HNH endonuclease n=1 Tax=Salipiger marinus TaxID=555512 RepID=UPI001E53A1B3|nr:HNH endonuclease signature motif containing protein [Salipiger manganoxidans]MCD1619172.1 HNH endonuclease [Salipiger manganoxidans]